MSDNKLIPTVGFGKVRFGMSIDEVKAILGEPDEEITEQLGESPDDLSTQLTYDEFGLSLSFDKAVDFKLVDVMTDDDCKFSLGENIHLGDKRDDVFAAVLKNDWGPIEEHDIEDDLDGDGLDEEELEEVKGLTEYELPEVSVNLWFRNGVLDTVQIGPEYDDDDNILWPKK